LYMDVQLIVPASFVENGIFPPLNFLCTFVKSQIHISQGLGIGGRGSGMTVNWVAIRKSSWWWDSSAFECTGAPGMYTCEKMTLSCTHTHQTNIKILVLILYYNYEGVIRGSGKIGKRYMGSPCTIFSTFCKFIISSK
jgi:hypothetical protein